MTEDIYAKYETVVGLEVHAQLSTLSKIYAPDSAEFGALPNTHVSMITTGHPGTLPKLNKTAVAYAVKMGLATHCNIRSYNEFARKNYFYADLPKGYQITQHTTPICFEGHLDVKLKDGSVKHVGITRIHLEEDAGKSMHDQDVYDSLIDLNRAGVPLIEIVSEPDIRSSEEAGAYLTEIRKIVRYLEVCDGNMEEGSMRCDANVSVRLKGATTLGNRCEIKNLNSIRNVQRAIEFEAKRQIEAIEAGETITQNTLNYDAATGTTSVLRTKEMANDYRYFPEPDLPPVVISEAYIADIQANMPALPEQLLERYTSELGLTAYDATNLIDERDQAIYFEQIIQHTTNYKAAANWLMGTIRQYLNTQAIDIKRFELAPAKIAEIIALVDEGKINNTTAAQNIFPAMVADTSLKAIDVATAQNLIIETNTNELNDIVAQALALFPDKVAEYKNGKKGVLGLFMGEVMKLSKGKLDPKTANAMVMKALDA